ncbi:MAG: hypothetical protein O3A63_15050 [Proteobacteria bacterium]|nr:hypothetical protein [Pseudomonadota bacterium]
MRLTNHDATFLYSETASGPMHGAAIAVIDGELRFEQIFDHIASRLHLIPRYRQRLAFVPFNLAHPKWVDDPDFDLTNHVKLKELAAGACVDDAVAAAMKLAEPLLPRNRPLWLMYVITGVAGKTLLLQMGHHAMVDGASGIDISLILFDLQANAPAPSPPSQAWSPAPLPSPAELAIEAVREGADELLASIHSAVAGGVKNVRNCYAGQQNQ